MKLSLGRKIVIMVILIAVLLCGTCLCASGVSVRRMMDSEYVITADSMAATVAETVPTEELEIVVNEVMELYRASEDRMDNTRSSEPDFKNYSAKFLYIMDTPEFVKVREELRSIQTVSEVDCVYTLFICPEEKTAVYIVDAAWGEEMVTPGCYDYLEESCYKYLSDPEIGLPAFITNTKEYGWVVTSCAPIHNSKGEIICYSAVDLSMNDILGKISLFLSTLAVILVVLTAVICIIAIVFVRKKIIAPINMLSEAAEMYGQKQDGSQHKEFSSLSIHTGDELEILLRSMIHMEKDIDKYIENLTRTKAQLSTARQKANDMQKQAHMDSLTGIRSRFAYDKEMQQLDKGLAEGVDKFGIAMIDLNYLKKTNDTYGHEAGDAALVSLTRLVCTVFAHSPVFRIGGDEFAVILRSSDLEHIEQLVKEFNRRLEMIARDSSLKPWEKISAALGYAIYDGHKDSCVDDVFKRADSNMYEKKKAMKLADGNE